METVADRPGHDRRYASDATRFKNDAGWTAKTSFVAGLEKTVRWYLENSDWCDAVRAKGYSGERLGLSPK